MEPSQVAQRSAGLGEPLAQVTRQAVDSVRPVGPATQQALLVTQTAPAIQRVRRPDAQQAQAIKPTSPPAPAVEQPPASPAPTEAPAIQRVARAGTKPVVQRRSIGEPLTSMPDTATPVARPSEPVEPPPEREPGLTPMPGSHRPPARPQNGSAAPPADPIDGLDMDELARRLYEPLNRMLRAEIRLDRERAGRGHERRY
ncbi:hypothetical protein [Kutzneria sp. CA-103260]|uniref:hypothetical protein n=1 Tax=Kutzneria sp. CA-103260 TaxID=2802641 RepID=UPI001BA68753|nr:hypothetical protein [Kutzneria sp. CA-103260]